MNNIITRIQENGKQFVGWSTKKKIVVFSVDDYGNVRLGSQMAKNNLGKAGIKIQNRFDAYDTLESTEDLELLFETLHSVKDKNDRPAVFTPFSVVANINFEESVKKGKYLYELLPATFEKTQGSNRTFALWQEGIRGGFFLPQFHGREHLNIKMFNHLLDNQSPDIVVNLNNASYTGISSKPWPNIKYTEAFSIEDTSEVNDLKLVVTDGLDLFEKTFGYKAHIFMPPGGELHPELYVILKESGIDFLESSFLNRKHLGGGRYRKEINYVGKVNKANLHYLVRNCVFEPTKGNGVNWIEQCLKQIERAFRWNRPAHISSHRVNYCGTIDENNREIGLNSLSSLLKKIVKRWPDVEFMSADELAKNVKAGVH